MPIRVSPHARAVLQALLVTFLWSTSWVLIKVGLDAIPALTFAGLRYTLAWLCLLGVGFLSTERTEKPHPPAPFPCAGEGESRQGVVPSPSEWGGDVGEGLTRGALPGTYVPTNRLAMLRRLSRREWGQLALLGLIFYTMTQGAQFLALERLPATTISLLLSFSPVVVALLGMILLDERLTRAQWGGIALYLSGAVTYFYRAAIPTGQMVGLIIAIVGLLANALAAILGRDINRRATLPPLPVTVASMGIGAPVLLLAGIMVQPAPALDLQGVAIIGWLAVVNTAFAFTLWNHTQRTLSAIESSIINNTMLIQIAALAWIFLGEELTAREIRGLALAAVGTLIVQVRRAQPRRN
jgi:drug/metabolite transporter (DMT)-like permease